MTTYYSLIPLLLIFIQLTVILPRTSSAAPQESIFDFIIVGGGTAGMVLARRLSEAEDHKFTVLVLESGEEPPKDSEIPAYAPRYMRDPKVTFRYKSVPQKNAGQRNEDGILPVLSGRMLAGTSFLNYMLFNRGSPLDYDNWAKLTQDPSWSYSNMLKYFKRAETYRGDYLSYQHGSSGPLTISRPKYSPGVNYWLEAGESLGYNVWDPNGPQKVGFAVAEFTKKKGRRVNSFAGYVKPIMTTSPNLQIALKTNATRIVFIKNRAIGIEFESEADSLQNISNNCVFASREIILSAGNLGSALLLLRSGIGPRDSILEAHIPLVAELPVGLRFLDHVALSLPFIVNSSELVMDDVRDLNPQNLKLYEESGDGPYSSTVGVCGQAFVASSVAKSEGEGDWPDLQLKPTHNKQTYFATGIVGPESVESWEGPMGADVFLTRPKSSGTLKLDPGNPHGPPLIDVGFLSDPRDVQKMKDGINEIMRILEETPAYMGIGARFPSSLNLPWCSDLEFRSEEFWECYIRYMSHGGSHIAGTCRMGKGGSDSEAVVDSELRVIGIERLRVVDASIMPFMTNSNTQAPVYGIAEKASDMILQEWK